MKYSNQHRNPLFIFVAALLALTLVGYGCEEADESIDNTESQAACKDYCSKKFDCDNHSPSANDTNNCVNACRNSIEDNCGNEHQEAANDKLEQCVDKACVEFAACLIFDTAPECFGFVGAN